MQTQSRMRCLDVPTPADSFRFVWLKPTENEGILTGHEAERASWKQVVKAAEGLVWDLGF